MPRSVAAKLGVQVHGVPIGRRSSGRGPTRVDDEQHEQRGCRGGGQRDPREDDVTTTLITGAKLR